MVRRWSRRAALLAAGAAAIAYLRQNEAPADAVTDLTWTDLLPQNDPARAVSGIVEHEQIASSFAQPTSTGTRRDWDAQRVRLPGYTVPVVYEDDRVREFLLVPYVGACIHVPPPPANQLVYVRSDTPFVSTGLFDPVRVTGRLDSSETSTRLARIGYTMQAEAVAPG